VATATPADIDAQVDRYRVQAHFMRHGCWVQQPPLLSRCAGLPQRPTLILQGTADRICPPDGAQALHSLLPHSRYNEVAGVGHDPSHPAMVDAMVRALDSYAAHGSFDAAGAPA
jgi:proline iminopeptidase